MLEILHPQTEMVVVPGSCKMYARTCMSVVSNLKGFFHSKSWPYSHETQMRYLYLRMWYIFSSEKLDPIPTQVFHETPLFSWLVVPLVFIVSDINNDWNSFLFLPTCWKKMEAFNYGNWLQVLLVFCYIEKGLSVWCMW